MEEEKNDLKCPVLVIRISQKSQQEIDALLNDYELSFQQLQTQWIEKEITCSVFKFSENVHRLNIPLNGLPVFLRLHLNWDSLSFSYRLKEDRRKENIVLLSEKRKEPYDEFGWRTQCMVRFIEEQEAYFPQPDLVELYEKVEQLETMQEQFLDKTQQIEVWTAYIEGLKKQVEKLQQPISVKYFHPLQADSQSNKASQKYYHLTLNLKEDEDQLRMEKQIGVVLSRSDLGNPIFNRWENRFSLNGIQTLPKEVLKDIDSICLKHYYSLESEPVYAVEGRVDLQPNPALQPIFAAISSQLQEEYGISADFDAWGNIQLSLEALPAFDKIIEERYKDYVRRNPMLGCIIKIEPFQRIHELEDELRQFSPSVELGINSNKTKLFVSHVNNNPAQIKKKVEDWGGYFIGEAKKVSILNHKADKAEQKEFFDQHNISFFEDDIKSNGDLTGIILPELRESIYGDYPFYYKKVETDQELGEVYLKNFENYLGTLYGRENIEINTELLFELDNLLYSYDTAFSVDDWIEIKETCQLCDVKVYEEQQALYFEFETAEELNAKIESLKAMKLFKLNYKPFYYKYKVRSEWAGYGLDKRKQILEGIAGELSVFPGDLTLRYTNEECTMAYLKYVFATRTELAEFMESAQEISEKAESFDISFKELEGNTSYYFSKIDGGQFGLDEQIKAIKGQEVQIFPKEYSTVLREIQENPNNRKPARLQKVAREMARKKLKIGKVVSFNTSLRQITLRLNEKQKDQFNQALRGNPLRYDLTTIYPRVEGEVAKVKWSVNALEKLKEAGKEVADSKGFVNPNLANYIFDASAARPLAEPESLKPGSEAFNLLEKYQQLELNARQKEAVLKAILAEDMALIQGPPGTGKTTAIAELAWQLIVRNRQGAYKLLVTSETNLAVDNALEKLENSEHTIVKPIRFGSMEKLEDGGKRYSLVRMKRWSQGCDEKLTFKTDSGTETDSSKNNAVRSWMLRIADKSEGTTREYEDLQDILEEWQKDLREPEQKAREIFSQKYLKHANVICSTCSSVASRAFINDYYALFKMDEHDEKHAIQLLSFDAVIMDEASKVPPVELLLPLGLARKSILIGDKKNVPPLFLKKYFLRFLQETQEKEKVALNPDLSYFQESQFKRLIENPNLSDTLTCQLDTQYRMHEDINAVVRHFYPELPDGLKCGITSHQERPYSLDHTRSRYHGIYNTLNNETDTARYFLTSDTHVLWINVDTPEMKEGTSRINIGEVEAVKKILEYLRYADGFDAYQKQWKKKETKNEIGLISFYKAQIALLEQAQQYGRQLGINIRLKSANKFQGMERNIVIVSMVRSDKIVSSSGRISNNKRDTEYPAYSPWGYAESPERLSAALSRARSLLIIVGNKHHFETFKNPQGEAVYKNVIRVIEEKGKVIHYKELVKYES